MALIDAGAARTMGLASEVMELREAVARQRRTIWGLAMVLRGERAVNASLIDLLDALLADLDA